MNWGIGVLQTRALPLGYVAEYKNGADDGARTRYLNLGKVALYQMSYIRIFCFLSGTYFIIRHGKKKVKLFL